MDQENQLDMPRIIELDRGLWVRQEVDNMGWVVIGDEVLVIDALEQAKLEDEVMEAIAETTGKRPVRWVLNTHAHYDHVALNPAFVRRFGAEIVGLNTGTLPPEGIVFGTGGRSVRMIPMPHCHTQDDAVVWLESESVLFVGDIFGWGLIPWDRPLDRAKLDAIIQTYEELVGFGARTVVPGHGPLCSTRELERWIAYIRKTVSLVKDLYSRGRNRQEINTELVPAPADMSDWWRFLQWKHEDTVKKIVHAVCRQRL